MEKKYYATEVVKKLKESGYTAYFAGGWVRDFVMGHPSQDIDIATNAPPPAILDLFQHTVLVGLAFGVVIVVFEGYKFEVSTFRRDVGYIDGRKPSLIELATPEEDAKRRDFTINGMFYDPVEHVIHDYVHGVEDIKAGIIRTIGNPDERFVEDRLRMIRAVRFSARFGFVIDSNTRVGIIASADTLFPSVAMERIWNEFTKMAEHPGFDQAIVEMQRLELLPVIFPSLQGIHLNDMRHRVAPFAYFPEKTSTIAYLLELFPEISDEEIAELCQYLKASTDEMKFALFLNHGKRMAKEKSDDPHAWAKFYSDLRSGICLKIIAAKLPVEEQAAFLGHHEKEQENMKPYIDRIVARKPLINASLLQEHGIKPGKVMGTLIKEAEKMSIRQRIQEPAVLLKQLRSSSHWPRS